VTIGFQWDDAVVIGGLLGHIKLGLKLTNIWLPFFWASLKHLHWRIESPNQTFDSNETTRDKGSQPVTFVPWRKTDS